MGILFICGDGCRPSQFMLGLQYCHVSSRADVSRVPARGGGVWGKTSVWVLRIPIIIGAFLICVCTLILYINLLIRCKQIWGI